jgi:hypothetical protein
MNNKQSEHALVERLLLSGVIYNNNQINHRLLTKLYLKGENGEENPIIVDGKSYMSEGPGRFANPSQSKLIKYFFADKDLKPKSNGQPWTRNELSDRYGLYHYEGETKHYSEANIPLMQYEFGFGTSDYTERVYNWQSNPYAVNESAKFYVSSDGKKHIGNFAIYPLNENFDLNSDSLSSSMGNYFLRPAIDPNGTGKEVIITFDNSGIPLIANYTLERYQEDLLSQQGANGPKELDVYDFIALFERMKLIVRDLETAGIIPPGAQERYDNLLAGFQPSTDTGASLGETDLPPISDDNGHDKAPGVGKIKGTAYGEQIFDLTNPYNNPGVNPDTYIEALGGDDSIASDPPYVQYAAIHSSVCIPSKGEKTP